MDKYRIGKIFITKTTPKLAVETLTQAALNGVKGQVCVSNVRTVNYAQHCPEYAELMNSCYMCTPDGMPLTWMARLWGIKDSERTIGPDMMIDMLNDTESGIKHFLLGDTDDTLKSMREKFSYANIVGTYSPPFCSLDDYDYPAIAKMINESGAQIVWFSLRSPKQDYMAQRMLPLLGNVICIGVGAAFRYGLGEYKDPPRIIKMLGLTGMYWRKNKLADLWWNIKMLTRVSWWGMQILFNRITGKKYYE